MSGGVAGINFYNAAKKILCQAVFPLGRGKIPGQLEQFNGIGDILDDFPAEQQSIFGPALAAMRDRQINGAGYRQVICLSFLAGIAQG